MSEYESSSVRLLSHKPLDQNYVTVTFLIFKFKFYKLTQFNFNCNKLEYIT